MDETNFSTGRRRASSACSLDTCGATISAPGDFCLDCRGTALIEALRRNVDVLRQSGAVVGERVGDGLTDAILDGRLCIPKGLTFEELVEFFSRLVRRTLRWRIIDQWRRGGGDLPMAA